MPSAADGRQDADAVNAAVPRETQRRVAAVLKHLGAAACASAGPADVEDLAGPSTRTAECERHLFDPKRYANTQKPLLEASTLPRECYTSRGWYERESERVFTPSWSCVGREDEVAQAGQYLAIDTEWGGPVAVCRGRDGALHGFANVCRHRGAKVLQHDVGKGPSVGFVCPYHAWTYDFDGKLRWAPGMDDVQGFDEDEVRLEPVRCDAFHGFIFVSVDPGAPALLDCLGDLPEKMAPWFGPEGVARNMITVARRDYLVDCNWKFLMENTCETYHTAVVHKGSLGSMRSAPLPPHVGDWDAVEVQGKRSVVPLPEDFEGETFPLPAFTNRTCFINLFPSLQINVTWDCLWWMRLFPQSPTQTHIQMGFCFPPETTKLERFPQVLERYLHRWHVAVMEDNAISLNQMRGMRSKFRTPGRFQPLEFGTHNFNNWLLTKMLDGAHKWDPGRRVFTGDGEWHNDDERVSRLADEVYEPVVGKARAMF